MDQFGCSPLDTFKGSCVQFILGERPKSSQTQGEIYFLCVFNILLFNLLIQNDAWEVHNLGYIFELLAQ